MMVIAHLLEDFGTAPLTAEAAESAQSEQIEEQRLAVFEQGYTAGWDDAIAAQAREHAQATGALARNLEDISFTYHEALAQMLALVEPVFGVLLEQVLPAALSETFGGHLVAEIARMASGRAAQPVEVVVCPADAPAVRPVLERGFAMPVRLTESRGLEPGQALVRLGGAERGIDCNRLLASLRDAAEAYMYQISQEVRNG